MCTPLRLPPPAPLPRTVRRMHVRGHIRPRRGNRADPDPAPPSLRRRRPRVLRCRGRGHADDRRPAPPAHPGPHRRDSHRRELAGHRHSPHRRRLHARPGPGRRHVRQTAGARRIARGPRDGLGAVRGQLPHRRTHHRPRPPGHRARRRTAGHQHPARRTPARAGPLRGRPDEFDARHRCGRRSAGRGARRRELRLAHHVLGGGCDRPHRHRAGALLRTGVAAAHPRPVRRRRRAGSVRRPWSACWSR